MEKKGKIVLGMMSFLVGFLTGVICMESWHSKEGDVVFDYVIQDTVSNRICRSDMVMTPDVAKDIAVIIWTSKFGKECPRDESPYRISLKEDSLWVVHGSHKNKDLGGAAGIIINKKNGTIVRVYSLYT